MKVGGLPSFIVVFILSALLLVFCSFANAQPSRTIRRIGYLFTGFQPPKEFLDAMARLGYVEGKDISFVYRAAEGQEERLPELAAELINLNVDVIVAPGVAAGLAVKKITRTVPVVYLGGGDPVALGLVASLARPGGNITGISELSGELTGKRLDLLKETFPKASVVAVLVRSGAPGEASLIRHLDSAANALGFKLIVAGVRRADDLALSFSTFAKKRPSALMELPNPLFHANNKRIVEFAANYKLPTIFHSKDFVEVGGLMAYGADFTSLYHRAAVFVDKILKGTKPADLPVEQPRKFEFVINLKAAKQIGLTIPPNVLARADRVIR